MNNNENNVYNNVNNTGFNTTPVNNTNGMYNSNSMYNPNNVSVGSSAYVNPNTVGPTPQVNTVNSQIDHMAAVSNLNKEEAMEEALSHTNQYTPFEVPKQEVIDTPKTENPKSAYIFLAVILIVMALFIAFLPQISKLFGW